MKGRPFAGEIDIVQQMLHSSSNISGSHKHQTTYTTESACPHMLTMIRTALGQNDLQVCSIVVAVVIVDIDVCYGIPFKPCTHCKVQGVLKWCWQCHCTGTSSLASSTNDLISRGTKLGLIAD